MSKGVQRVIAPKLKNPRWRASLYRDGRRINLGSFDSQEAAAEAYRNAVFSYEEMKNGADNASKRSGIPERDVLDARLRECGPA
jgi:hypothetical protein